MNDKFSLQETTNCCKRPYKKPQLTIFGDLQALTLGGTPGFNDSGDTFVKNPFMGGYIPGQKDTI